MLSSIYAVVGLVVWGIAIANESEKKADKAKVSVGVFDSRAVACAHFGKFIKDGGLKKLYNEHDKAKSAGDTKRAEQLEAKGQALQKQLHMRVFGSAPIDDILKKIKKDIPQIA